MSRKLLFAAAALAFAGSLDAMAGERAAPGPITPQLIDGWTDANSPTRNAVAHILTSGFMCTATLVAPDIVMTSAHCIPTFGGTPRADGTWESMMPGVSSVVSFGPNPATPIRTHAAHMVNYPGTDDIILVGLDQSVSSTVALPRALAFDPPAGLDGADLLYNVGYGNGALVRQWGYSREYRPFQSVRDPAQADNYFCFNDVFGQLGPGDSGSPLLWADVEGPVMGVYQGNATCKTGLESPGAPFTGENDGAVMTYGRGNTFGTKVDVSWWLRRNVLRSYCSRTTPMASRSDAGMHLKLQNWWSGARLDNFLTSQADWSGCFTNWDYEVEHDGYAYFRNEGWVLSPATPAPAGSTAVYLWWNASSRDNATSTLLVPITRSGWVRGSLLGYAYTTPTARSSLVPLRLWYSAGRQDYLTTTATTDYSTSGYVRVGSGVGGGGPGVIGYVVSPAAIR